MASAVVRPDFVSRMLEWAQCCASPAEFQGLVLAELRSVVGCDGAIFRAGAHWRGASPVFLDEASRFTDAYLRHEARYKPELTRWCELSHGSSAFLDHEIYPASEQRRMAIYSEVMHPERIHNVLSCPITFRAQTVGLVFLVRHGSGSRFTADAAQELTRLTPAVGLAAQALARLPAATAGSAPSIELAPPARPRATPDDAKVFRAAYAQLSGRERQIAMLVAQGLQSKEIAALVGTSFHTVRKQTLRLFEKLALHDRTQVALAMQRAGLAQESYVAAAG